MRGRPSLDSYCLAGKNLLRDLIRRLPRTPKPPKTLRATNAKRDADFLARYKAGETLEQIGDSYGITRERVRQRLAAYGVNGADGGRSIQTLLTCRNVAAARKAKLDGIEARFFARWGMSREDMLAISPLPRPHSQHPVTKYFNQRSAAASRGIAWELNFRQWWDFWQASGKWGQRGRFKDGYVMARWGDSGPYSVDNVHICTLSENSAEHWIPRRLREAA